MKRRDLIRHLVDNGCRLVREGGETLDLGESSERSPHVCCRVTREIPDFTARRICLN